jgi:ABC-2 type transport system permease protein
LVKSELLVFVRQPVMIALSLLVPAGLLGITAIAEPASSEAWASVVWASVAGRDTAAILCITVYFIALNTITARRHTLALKRLRTTALTDIGIVTGLLVAPVMVGLLQLVTVWGGLIWLSGPSLPLPASPVAVVVAGGSGLLVAALAGLVTSALTANPEKAQWTMLPLFVGAMGAVALLPAVSNAIGDVGLRLVPLVANADLASTGWASDGDLARAFVDSGIIGVWLVVLGLLSKRTFRWERRR